MTQKTNKGTAFTLIELLVVIAIIGLLSSIVLASLSGARERAQITRMASDLEQIETAMTMWMQGEGYAQWPNDSNYTTTDGNIVPLDVLMDESAFSEYINTAPEPPIGGDYYAYDAENDVYTCGGTESNGINIYVREVPADIQKDINSIIDGKNESTPLDCGKVVGTGTSLVYKLSYDTSF